MNKSDNWKFAIAVLGLLAVLALWQFAPAMWISVTAQLYAQAGTQPVVTSNPGIFVQLTSEIQTPSFEIEAGVASGQVFLGQVEFHVDATSRYEVSASSSFEGSETSVPSEIEFVEGASLADACLLGIDGGSNISGDPGPNSEQQNSTAGTGGQDHVVDLEANLAVFESLIEGSYVCDVEILILDSQNNPIPLRGRVEYSVTAPD